MISFFILVFLQMPLHILKVWSCDREKKCAVVVEESDSLINEVIIKANVKLNIDGEILVLESDGTPIDENEIMMIMKGDVFLLLKKETWTKFNGQINNTAINDINIADNEDNEEVEDENAPPNSANPPSTQSAAPSTSRCEWTNFIIPWASLDADVLGYLKSGVKNNRAIKTIEKIIAEMRVINVYIPENTLKSVAICMRDAYLDVFEGRLSKGERQGDGVASLH